MADGKHYEIEKKYLIRYPDAALLAAQPGAVKWEITQLYLTSAPGETRRIRQVGVDGLTKYYKTFKRRVSGMTAEEDEGEISQFDYIKLSREGAPGARPVVKTRYRVPWAGHLLEFDLYPFWQDRAILEVELEAEDEPHAIPEWVQIIRDVSDDLAYKNSSLAREIPHEDID